MEGGFIVNTVRRGICDVAGRGPLNGYARPAKHQAADATILTPQLYVHMLETLQPYVLTDILNLYAGRSGLHI